MVSVYLGSHPDRSEAVTSFDDSEVTVVDDHFQVDWDTGAAEGGLPDGAADCWIEVSWDGAVLGFVDCQIDRTNGKGNSYLWGSFLGRALAAS